MEYLNWLPLVSCLFCAAIAAFVFVRRRGNYGAMAFSLGMASLALMELANFLTVKAVVPRNILFWKEAGLWCEILMVGNWLLFAFIYAKDQITRVLKKWGWLLALAYMVPSGLLILLLVNGQITLAGDFQSIELGTVAIYFHISLLVVLIMTLVNIESTFRALSDTDRWQIKHTFFGLGAILIFYIYILSQRLLYNSIELSNIYLMSAAIILSNGLMIYSYLRNKIIIGDIYISRNILHGTASLFTIGIYLILVGLVGQLIRSLNLNLNIKIQAIFIFFSILALVVIFSKDTIRRRIRKAVNRHFRKDKYDYREEWRIFSTVLSRRVHTAEIGEAFVRTLVERIYARKISLWLVDEAMSKLYMLSSKYLPDICSEIDLNHNVLSHLFASDKPLSLSELLDHKGFQSSGKEISTLLDETRAELLVPITLGGKPIGLLTLGKIRGGEPFDEVDDYDLLKSVAAHAASAINSAKMFEEQMRAKELEAFHRLSSFVMHDMKNATTMLSMLAQNAEKHLCDPEFQKDALQTISEAVNRMKRMIESLSSLPDKPKLELKDCDLNELINTTVNDLGVNGLAKLKIERNLGKLSPVRVDAEEIQKVFHNLILNACEALDSEGQVEVSSRTNKDHVIFSVSDNGRGMSREFMEKSLFKPFKSTKKKGLGIGLYQCKSIVEAHKGRIEVESELGEGTTFTVYLPTKQA
jgi:putative PEP-CTERM system histidine kinase